MATATRTRPNVLSYSAYALIGAADRALQETRSLAGRREELPDDLARQLEESVAQMRDSLDKVVDHLGSRVKQTTGDAGETLDDFAARGRAILDRIRETEEVSEAQADFDQARQGWMGAVTTLRRNAEGVVSRVKAAGTMTGEAASSTVRAAESMGDNVVEARDRAQLQDMTKGELYEMATTADIDGRSTMSKAELVDALSATS